jgi:hypothetical protein
MARSYAQKSTPAAKPAQETSPDARCNPSPSFTRSVHVRSIRHALQAEINVAGRDIGQVSVGQSVRIKFEAFPFQKYGIGSGAVRVISQDSISPDPKAEGAVHTTVPTIAYWST